MKKSLRSIVASLLLVSGVALGASTAQAAVTYSMPYVTVNGGTANIQVTISGLPSDKTSLYAIQVGNTSDNATTCTKDANVAPSTPTASLDGKTLTLSYAPYIAPGVTYCVNVTKQDALISTPNVVKTFAGQTFLAAGTTTLTGGSTTATNAPNENGCVSNGTDGYCAIAPIPSIGDSTGKIDFDSCVINGVKDTTPGVGFGCYVNSFIKLIIGLVAVFTVVMLIISGLEVMLSDIASEKAAGKARALNAIFGLVIALGSFMLLNTINPHLVNLSVSIPEASLTYDDSMFQESEFSPAPTTQSSLAPSNLRASGFICPGTGGSAQVAAVLGSMQHRVTYRFGGGHSQSQPPYSQDTHQCPKNSTVQCSSFCPAGQLCLDCSAFADTVLKCAGISGPGGGTGSLFSTGNGAESITASDIVISGNMVTVKGKPLQDGDLLGWLAGEKKGDPAGHVLIYSQGMLYDSHGGNGGREPGGATGVVPVSKYVNDLKHLYRVN